MKKFFAFLILLLCSTVLFADELLQVRAQNSEYDYAIGYALVSDGYANSTEHRLAKEFLTTGLYYTKYSTNDWNLALDNLRYNSRKNGLSIYIADASSEKIALIGPASSLRKAKNALGSLFLQR